MKKIFLILLCFLMIGCQNESNEIPTVEEVVLTSPVIHLETNYAEEQSFELNDVFEYDGELIVYIDGKKLEGSTLELESGDHRIEAYYLLDGKESPHSYLNIRIGSVVAYEMDLYESINGASVKISKDDFKTSDIIESYYFNNNGKLDVWHLVTNKTITGFIKSDLVFDYKGNRKHIFELEHGTYEYEGDIKTFDNTILSNGYFVFGDYENTIIVNEFTGEVLQANNIYISPDGLNMITVTDKLSLYELLIDDYNLLQEVDWTYGAPWQVAFFEDNISVAVNTNVAETTIREFLFVYNNGWTFKENILNEAAFYDVFPSRNTDSVYNESISSEVLSKIKAIKYLSITETGYLLWYEIPESRYVLMPYQDFPAYDFVCDKEGNIISGSNGPIKKIKSFEYAEDGLHLLEDGDNTLVYDVHNNELMSLYKVISEENNTIISTVTLEDNSFVVIFEVNKGFTEKIKVPIENDEEVSVEWLNENEFIINQMSFSDDIWLSTDYYKTYYNRFHMKLTDGSYSIINTPVSDTAAVYRSMTDLTSVGELKLSESKVVFLNTYAIIDSELVLWFKVDDFYAYRPLRYGEVPVHSPQDPYYHFVLSDGSVVDMEALDDLEYIRIEDDLEDKGYFTNFSSYEWYIGDFINATSGEHFRVDGTPILSEDDQYLCAVETVYGTDESIVYIYSFSDEKIELLDSIFLGQWTPKNIIWSEHTILMDLMSYSSSATRTAEINLIDKEWIYTIHETN